jgi:DNA-binding MarR family transcriptional regulator
MANGRPQSIDDEHRLVSLDPRDLEDLRRLIAKLHPDRRPGCPSGQSPVQAHNDADPLIQQARLLLDNRRKRVAIFGPQMFAEPAWEMILTLYVEGGGRRHTQTSLVELSGASRSTGMRWIDYLVGEGLICREEHPTDRRRNFVSLSEQGRTLLELYLSETNLGQER